MSQEVDAEKKARNLIDKMLENSGWNIIRRGNPVPDKSSFVVEEVETPTGPMYYGLYLDGVLVSDVEAKPEKIGVPGIIAQDERYSKSYDNGTFNFDGYHIPFLYASNGHLIWFRDVH
jgi:type I restriction enzyme R subunit